MDLPHGRRPSLLEDVWRTFRGAVSGPLGCLAAIVCFPFAILALLVILGVALWKGRKLAAAMRSQIDAERGGAGGGGGGAGDAAATAALVRSLALDPTFTAEEARQTAVPAWCGRPAADLLDDAVRRGWIAESGGRLAVTDEGREQAEAVLRARGL